MSIEVAARIIAYKEPSTPSADDITRFQSKVEKLATEGGCWVWMGSTYRDGYGRFWLGDVDFLAHRISYLLAFGELPCDKMVLHQCDNHPCVNPAHLFIGTALDNMIDKVTKGRHNNRAGDKHHARLRPELMKRGESHPFAVLTETQVREIHARHAKGVKGCEMALDYNTTKQTISAILLGKRWKHLKP